MKQEILSLIELYCERAKNKKRPASDLRGELIIFINFLRSGDYEIVNRNKLIEIVKILKEITLIERLDV
ncbi:MAG TPA: hypothetical protein ENI19_01775 [Candidatus Nealsonbacteria bacterium]|uniref:Uncharacterized protein n=1 Tax=marine sediment metagenome TaxID=412755 RepID=A0A0F9RLR2_9ZZZZ|nr:hypothetical protein [Candidatus Nealsonbacteria bacterium]